MSQVLCSAGVVQLPLRSEVKLAGFAQDRDWNGDVRFGLEANLLILHGGSLPVVLVAVDAVYVNELDRRLRAEHAGRVHLVLVASHSHYTPSLMPEYPGLGSCDPVIVDEWTATINDEIERLLATKPTVAKLQQARTRHRASLRRRTQLALFLKRPFIRWGPAFAPDREVDVEVCVSRFSGEGISAVFWSAPVHPTGFFDACAVTAEYPGFVRDALRDDDPGVCAVLFGQGASGDVRQPFVSRNPRRVGTWRFLSQLVPSGFRASFVQSTETEWFQWSGTLADKVRFCMLGTSLDDDGSTFAEVRVHRDVAPTGDYFIGTHAIPEVEVVALRVGALGWLFINAEVTTRLEADVQSAIAFSDVEWVLIGCAGECIGYAATEAEIVAGGYEGVGWPGVFQVEVSAKACVGTNLMAQCVRSVVVCS